MDEYPRFLRSEWGASHGRGPEHDGTRDLLVIHHFARPHIDCGETLEEEASTMQSVERFHAEVRGWGRIGYHWVVFASGHIYEGLGWGRIGAHTGGHNTRSFGVALAIDGDEHAPTPAAIAATQELVEEAMRGVLDPEFRLAGHRDFSPKSCPGGLVYPKLELFDPRLDPEEPGLRPVLGVGDRGPHVRALQELLEVGVDGIFGPNTQSAVAAFQLQEGLEDDGVVGPITWGALLE